MLIPALENPEKVKKFEELVNKRNNADYKCFMLLKQLFERVSESGLAKAYKAATGFDLDDVDYFITDIREAINRREQINDQVMRVIAGRD